MSKPNLTEDRLFVIEKLVEQILRRMPDRRDEILGAVLTTCEGSEGALLLAEQLQSQFDDGEQESAEILDRMVLFARRKNRIYGDPDA